ncbi:MAG: hypothetical protein MUC83_14120 [Pirellula sp.]|nr:hypothetical protein [Pirellula sp.]
MNDKNPYHPPLDSDGIVSDVRLPPHPVARLASVVLITLGIAFLIKTVISALFWHFRPLAADDSSSPIFSQSLRDLVLIGLLSIQVYAGFRSWQYRIPIIGCVATFVLCVAMTDTNAAPVFSPCLAAVGVLLYTGWFCKAGANAETPDAG